MCLHTVVPQETQDNVPFVAFKDVQIRRHIVAGVPRCACLRSPFYPSLSWHRGVVESTEMPTLYATDGTPYAGGIHLVMAPSVAIENMLRVTIAPKDVICYGEGFDGYCVVVQKCFVTVCEMERFWRMAFQELDWPSDLECDVYGGKNRCMKDGEEMAWTVAQLRERCAE